MITLVAWGVLLPLAARFFFYLCSQSHTLCRSFQTKLPEYQLTYKIWGCNSFLVIRSILRISIYAAKLPLDERIFLVKNMSECFLFLPVFRSTSTQVAWKLGWSYPVLAMRFEQLLASDRPLFHNKFSIIFDFILISTNNTNFSHGEN